MVAIPTKNYAFDLNRDAFVVYRYGHTHLLRTLLSIVTAMRKRAEWMTRADDEILEYLQSQGAGTPKSIADEIDRNNNYIGVRCRKLASYGLVDRPSRGFYVITDYGTEYLEGELDASTLEQNGE